MNLSGVPVGYLSLSEVVGIAHRMIKAACDNSVDLCVQIVGEDARRAPPQAMGRAAFQPVFAAIVKSELQVLTMHSQSGAIVRVPGHVFAVARDPRSLVFPNPDLHEGAGLPEAYSQYLRHPFFVSEVEGLAIGRLAGSVVLSAFLAKYPNAPNADLVRSILREATPVAKKSRNSDATWLKESRKFIGEHQEQWTLSYRDVWQEIERVYGNPPGKHARQRLKTKLQNDFPWLGRAGARPAQRPAEWPPHE